MASARPAMASPPRAPSRCSAGRAWDESVEAHVALHRRAAIMLQARARGWLVRSAVDELLAKAVAPPQLKHSREYARSLLPRDQEGRLLPLGCNVHCFKVFGSGVYCYMRWCKLMQTVFLYAFTLSLANLIHNVTGGGLFGTEGTSFLNAVFTATTLGNASMLNSSYGAVEVLVSAVFAYGMFRGHAMVVEEEEITDNEIEATQADYTLLVSNLPPTATDSHELALWFTELGNVTHAVIALANRDLLLRMPERQKLLAALHERQAVYFIARRRTESGWKRAILGGLGTLASTMLGRRERAAGRHEGAPREPAASSHIHRLPAAPGVTPVAACTPTAAARPPKLGAPSPTTEMLAASVGSRDASRPVVGAAVPFSSAAGAGPSSFSCGAPLSGMAFAPRTRVAERGTAMIDSSSSYCDESGGGVSEASHGCESASNSGKGGSGGVGMYSGMHHRDQRLIVLRQTVLAASAALANHDIQTHNMVQQQRKGTGFAFVSFASPYEADMAREALNSPGYSRLFQGRRLSARRAPEPSDVKWENLEIPKRERRWKQLLSTGIMFAVASFGTAVISATCYVQGKNVLASLTLGSGWVGGLLSLLVNLALLLPVVIGNVILFVSVPLLAERMERHTTFAAKELAIMLKLVFFQVYNSVFASFAFLLDPSVRLFERPWYTVGGALIANILFGDAIFIQVFLDWLRVGGLFSRFCLAPRAKTQLEMDRLYVDEADIYLAFRCQLAGKFVVLSLMFGTAIPLLYLIAAFYFWLAGWIDRTNLLRHLAPPPRTDAALVRALCLYVFPLSLALHAMMACFFFSSLPAEAARASIPVAGDGTGDADGTDSFPSQDIGSGEPGFFPSPPPPSILPLGITDEWFAFHIQLGALGAVVFILLSFYCIELARRHGYHLHLLSARQQQVVLSVFTQIDEQRAAIAVASSLHVRRNDEYLPPLNKSILHALGLDGARTTAHRCHNHVLRESLAAISPKVGRLASGGGGSVMVNMPRVMRSVSTSASAVTNAATAAVNVAASAAAVAVRPIASGGGSGKSPVAVALQRARSGGLGNGNQRQRRPPSEEGGALLAISSPDEDEADHRVRIANGAPPR